MSTAVIELDAAQDDQLRRLQSAKARSVRTERLARQSPAVRELVDDRNAHAAGITELRRKFAELETKYASLAAESSRLAVENGALRVQYDSLKSSLELKLELASGDNATLRTQLDDARTQLAAALKPKSRSS